MIRLRAEITTYCGSIASRVMGFSILQRVLNGYGSHTDPFSRDTGDFFGNIMTWEESDRYCSLVFRIGRLVLVSFLPQIPSGCRRDFTVTSLITEVELTFFVVGFDSACCCCNSTNYVPQTA
jgi:hypothetical protein